MADAALQTIIQVMTVLIDKSEVDRIDAALHVEELAEKLHYSYS